MLYREFGRTGLKVSRLGFGAMRLPGTNGADVLPDVEETVRVMHHAFAQGVNYVDTAVMYCAHGSEHATGEAVRRWPGKIFISTKNHYIGPSETAWRKNLDNSIARLGVKCIDVYHVHSLTWDKWEAYGPGVNGLRSWLHQARREGLIDHIVCSVHDTPEALERIAATGEFEAVTVQYNLLDRSMEPAFPALTERGMGIVIMGPAGGGRLSAMSPQLMELVPDSKSMPEMAFRFVYANPHVTMAISGMNTIAQVDENCAVASRPDPLSDEEHAQIQSALKRYKNLADLYCTGCNYCMPCPEGIDIPAVFAYVNLDRVYGLQDEAVRRYGRMKVKATACADCGKCEPKCPQRIPIRQQLREASSFFSQEKKEAKKSG